MSGDQRTRWFILGTALLAAMTTTCVVSGPAYLIPTLHTEGDLTLTQAAALSAVPTVGLLLTTIAWGMALDRYGERRILLLSLAITALGAVAAPIAVTVGAPLAMTAIAMFIGGAGSGAANGASGRIVVAWFAPNERGTAMGIRQMAQPLGVGVCALTMPWLAAEYGLAAALWVPAVVTVLGLGACFVGITDPPLRPVAVPAGTTGGTAVLTPNPYRASMFLVRVHAASILLVIPQVVMWTFVPTWLIVDRGWSPAAAGVLITLTQVVGALGRIAAGRLSDIWQSRMRPIRVISLGAAGAVGVLALLDYLDSPIAVAAMVVASVLSVADNGVAFTAIAEYAGPRWSGRGLAIQNTGQYLASSAIAPVFGALVAAVGFPLAYAIVALSPAAAVAVVPPDATSPESTPSAPK